MTHALLNLIAIVVIFGIGLWLINQFIPMPPVIKSVLNILVLVVLVIYILQFFGIVHAILPEMTILK